MFNPYSAEKYARIRQEEFWEWARAERLAHESRKTQRKRRYRWIWSLGQLMIYAGCWLQARQKPIL
jgi:hypothetical protein